MAASPSDSGFSTRRLLSPLRLRLLGLVAVASFPAALLIGRLAVDERRATFQRARESSVRVLDSAMVEQQELLRAGRQMIQALARLPAVADGDPAACERTMKLLIAAFPNVIDAERITPDLHADCGTLAQGDTLSDLMRDTTLARIVKAQAAVSGYYGLGRVGEPQVTIIEPIRAANGRVREYIAVDIELSWLSRLASALPPYPGAAAAITRADGFILARQPDPQALSGTFREPNETFRHMIALGNGVTEGPGYDDRPKLFVFRQLPSANESPVFLSVALPVEYVYGEANRSLRTNLLVAAVTLVLALMMAWVAADLLIIRDVQELVMATNRVASGDLSARVPTHTSGGELHVLADTFNNMAERLEERHREFLALGDASPDAIVRIGRDLRVDWANDALLRRLGTTLDRVAGMPITEVPVDSAVLPLVVQHVGDTFKEGERREVEASITVAGREGWIDLRFVPERDNAGEVSHVMMIARDVTARKHLEMHLAQAERLDSIGKLAGSIAHDFNNLLTAIIGNAEIAMRAVEPDHRVRADLTEILDVARRASSLTRQLLTFARRQPTMLRVIEVAPFIEDTAALLRRLLGENITLEMRFDPTAPRIRFDPTHLEQVLVNLVTNGRDAMPKGGTLTVEVSRAMIGPDSARGREAPTPGEYLLLRVSDTGVGMPPAVQERIFEPFFTTKNDRGGTGLGLAVTYGLVRQHGGFIEVESVEGNGTTFRIFFPATAERPEVRPLPTENVPARTGRETILLVEDQDPVRTTLARLLRSHGYSVEEARDGVDALRGLDKGSFQPINLVITDLVMPRMGGESLARELRQIIPRVPVMVISGYDERGSARAMLERGDAAALLEKPFESQPLLSIVRDLLDRAIAAVPAESSAVAT